MCIEIVYLIGSELVVGARVRLDLTSIELGLRDMIVRGVDTGGSVVIGDVVVELSGLNIADASADTLRTGRIHGARSK